MKRKNIAFIVVPIILFLCMDGAMLAFIFNSQPNVDEIKIEYGDSYEFSEDIVKTRNAEHLLEFDRENPRRIKAIECGNTSVRYSDGSLVNIYVEPARLTLVLFAGQSNCEGRLSTDESIETVRNNVVLNEHMTAFETYGVSDNNTSKETNWIDNPIQELSIKNVKKYLPQNLVDNSLNRKYNRTDTLTDEKGAVGKTGLDSAFAYEWYNKTGEKVWIVNAAHHGSRIQTWEPTEECTDNNFWQAVLLYQGAEEILSEEIKAGHFVLAHKGIIWCQGENNFNIDPNEYADTFNRMYESFKEQLNGKGIIGVERELDFCGIVLPRAALNKPDNDEDFKLTGPRAAQLYLTTNKGPRDIFLASNVAEKWYSDEAVKEYFEDTYGTENNFNKTYPKEDLTAKLPEVIGDVHGGFHYTQTGYNEIGFDVANNLNLFLNRDQIEKNSLEGIDLVTEEGIIDRSGETLFVKTDEYTPFAIKTFPAFLQKEVSIRCSKNIVYGPRGIMLKGQAKNGEISGEITVELGDIKKTVNVRGTN